MPSREGDHWLWLWRLDWMEDGKMAGSPILTDPMSLMQQLCVTPWLLRWVDD